MNNGTSENADTRYKVISYPSVSDNAEVISGVTNPDTPIKTAMANICALLDNSFGVSALINTLLVNMIIGSVTNCSYATVTIPQPLWT